MKAVYSMLTVGILCSITASAPLATAQPLPQAPGRYQIIALPKTTNEIGSAALVLDTATGDLWVWEQSPTVDKSPGGSGIFYQGRSVPGKEPGAAVAQVGYGSPPIQQGP